MHVSPSLLLRGFDEGLENATYTLVSSRSTRAATIWRNMSWRFWSGTLPQSQMDAVGSSCTENKQILTNREGAANACSVANVASKASYTFVLV